MKSRYTNVDELEEARVGGAWDTCTTAEENLWWIAHDLELHDVIPTPDDMYLLAKYPCTGVGFTAPKGELHVKVIVDNWHLPEIMKIVEHPREQLMVMMFAPKKAFPRDDGGDGDG